MPWPTRLPTLVINSFTRASLVRPIPNTIVIHSNPKAVPVMSEHADMSGPHLLLHTRCVDGTGGTRKKILCARGVSRQGQAGESHTTFRFGLCHHLSAGRLH